MLAAREENIWSETRNQFFVAVCASEGFFIRKREKEKEKEERQTVNSKKPFFA